METLNKVTIWTAEALGISGTAESQVISLKNTIKPESILFKASSVAGAAQVRVEFAISEDGVAFGGFDDHTDIIADSNADFANNKEGVHAVSLAAPLAQFMKFKITELSGSLSDTLVDMTLLLRRGLR